MKIVIIGLKNHPATIKLLNKLDNFPQHTFHLLQPIKINYSPKQIANLMKKTLNKNSDIVKIDRFHINLIFNNLGFFLKLAYYLYFNNKGECLQNNSNDEYEDGEKLSISYHLIEKYVRNVNNKKTESWLKKIDPDLIICSSNEPIIRDYIIKIPKIGIINTHPGILPKYRGMNPIEYTILNGDVVGATTYFIDSGVDTGNILFKSPINSERLSYIEIKKKMLQLLVDSNVKAIEIIENGNYKLVKQKLDEGVRFFPIDNDLIDLCELKILRKT